MEAAVHLHYLLLARFPSVARATLVQVTRSPGQADFHATIKPHKTNIRLSLPLSPKDR